MRRKRWPLSALALTAMVVLISACGSSAPAGTSTGTSSASDTGASSHTAANPNRGEAVKFAECIRSNGVSEFPDPNASGAFVYGIKAGSSLDPSSAAWKTAIAACRNLEPSDFMPTTFTTKQIEARVKFAQCVRDNGVPNFPDPTTHGPLVDVTNGSSIPGLQAALHTCLRLNPEATQ
jgi:hypothetical protein